MEGNVISFSLSLSVDLVLCASVSSHLPAFEGDDRCHVRVHDHAHGPYRVELRFGWSSHSLSSFRTRSAYLIGWSFSMSCFFFSLQKKNNTHAVQRRSLSLSLSLCVSVCRRVCSNRTFNTRV